MPAQVPSLLFDQGGPPLDDYAAELRYTQVAQAVLKACVKSLWGVCDQLYSLMSSSRTGEGAGDLGGHEGPCARGPDDLMGTGAHAARQGRCARRV